MTPVKPPSGNFRFRMIGGGLQLQIAAPDDLAVILDLDEAFWAVTSVRNSSLRFDRRFLEFVDSDHDGNIRSNEVKEALRFILTYFKDLAPAVAGCDRITVDSVNPKVPQAQEIIACIRLLLNNLGKSESDGLSDSDIRDAGSVTSFTRRNGDGVIACEKELSPELQSLVSAIIASGRTTLDRSGTPGVSMADVDGFEAALQRRIALFDRLAGTPSIMVYGEKTPEVCKLFRECEALLDGYFLNSAAGKFLGSDPERSIKKSLSADLMVPDDVRQVLASAAVAVPENTGILDFDAPLNPLYAGKLRKLASSCALEKFMDGSRLSEKSYLDAKAALAEFMKWEDEINQADGLEKLSESELRKLAAMPFDEIKSLIRADLEFAPVVGAGETLLKMALYQRYFVEFLNNFVALPDLFNPHAPSRLQMGKLIMDGRHFTLAVRVDNPAEHKRIIKTSNICVIYVEISRNNGTVPFKELLAVAVTSGTMRSLFIGKHGVFFDTDNQIYDAVIKDVSEQPVSIGEAFKAPFYNFADFMSKQTERIFNARNSAMQKNMTSELDKSQLAKVPPAPGANPAAANTAAAASPAGNLPMMLMGGGIGIAALGSSLAFIVKSMQNVSFSTVLAVLSGIVVIFGGPSVIIALIKLHRRSLSRFLECCGCAVNRPMRMSRKMGSIFTFVPKRPKGEISLVDPVNVFPKVEKLAFNKRFWIWFITLLLGIICGVCLAWWHISEVNRSRAAKLDKAPGAAELQQNNKPEAESEKNSGSAPKQKGENNHASPVA